MDFGAERSSLVRVDPRTGGPAGRPIRLEGPIVGIAAGARPVWAASADGAVTRIDPRSGRALTRRLGSVPLSP